MERAEKKIHEELNELFAATKRYKECDGYKDLLDFIGKFKNIAPYNAMLLNVQKPGSRYVATAEEWKKKFQRTVKVGATPLVTLFPFGPVRFVFELNDTEGKPFPEELLNPFRIDPAPTCKIEYQTLRESAAFDGVLCHERNLGTDAAGTIEETQAENKNQIITGRLYVYTITVLYEVVLNINHDISTRLATLAHELGHLYCGHIGSPGNKGWWQNRRGLDKNIKEFEAESVSWIICKRLGFDNPSSKYLKEYLDKNNEIPDISLEAVIFAANTIASRLSGKTMQRKEVNVSKKLRIRS